MSDIKIKSNKIIIGEQLFDGYIYVSNGKIEQVSPQDFPAKQEFDFSDKFVSPGFIEMHSHGAGGFSFLDGNENDVAKACECHLKHGATSILPTVTTSSFANMKNAVINIDKVINSNKCKANIIGAHLEGPYLSPEQCGAQCPDFITPPIKKDYESLINDYGKSIARWTYAPEQDTNGEFCNFLTKNNIIASAGHSNAVYSDMKVAVENGCNLITHLYSATSSVTRKQGFRSLGVIESAFLLDELNVELICDGKHLPPELIQMIIKIKGVDKVILTTDSMDIACTDIKSGNLSGIEFVVEEGVCRLKDRSAFAGSIATCDRLVKVLHFDCGFSIPLAVKMITKNPAKLLGLSKGSLEKGKDADIIVFDDDIVVNHVFVNGKLINFN